MSSHHRVHLISRLNLLVIAAGLITLVGLLLMRAETAVAAPTSAISLSIPYTQVFNTLAITGTGITWTDDSTIAGWYSTRPSYNTGNGSSNTGALYSFGSTNSTERALGSVASGGTNTLYYGVRLINDTPNPITLLKVSYTGEQWRNGGNTAQQSLNFSYQIGASVTSLTDGTWIPISDLDFTSPVATATAAALDGNLPANQTNVSYTIPLNIPIGQEIMLRWTDINDSGNDHGLALDDVVITNGALTYNSIIPDGDLSDWNDGSHLLGNNNSVDYYLTWDATYLYVGFNGGNATAGGDKYNVAVDTDPDDTGSENSGTVNEFNGATFGADGKPDFVVLLNNDNTVYKKTGASNWVDDWVSAETTAVDSNNNPGQVEFRLKWADMGLTDRNAPVGVYVWQSNGSDQQWGSYPPTNPGWSGSANYLPTRIYLPTTDNGRIPRTYAQHLGDQTQFDANGSFSLLNGFAQFNIISGGGSGCSFKVAVKGNTASDKNDSAVRRQYTIEPSGCTPTVDMTLTYMDGNYSAPDERNGYADTNDLKLFRWNGSAWEDAGGTANDTNNTVSVNNISAFSPWTFATSTGPTAVSLQSFAPTQSATGPVLLLALLALLLGGTAVIKRRTS